MSDLAPNLMIKELDPDFRPWEELKE